MPVVAPRTQTELLTALGRRPRSRLEVQGSGGVAGGSRAGLVLDMARRNQILSFDEETGVVVTEAGVTLEHLMGLVVPLGWMPSVVPANTEVSLGGAVASDFHGDNHVSAGSFGDHVRWLVLLRADGRMIRLSPHDDAPGFWATVGGMGLTGVIVLVALQLRPVATVVPHRDRRRTCCLDATLTLLRQLAWRQADDQLSHLVAWVDGRRSGSALGGGLVETSTHHRALQRTLCPWPPTFGWRGLVRYELAVPDEAETLLRWTLQLLQDKGIPPVVAAVTRLGPANRAPLSFPRQGWGLTLDLPRRWALRVPTLQRVGYEVAEASGRVHLASDPCPDPRTVELMYRGLPGWRQVRDRMDPGRRMTSVLADRLGLPPQRS